LFRTEKIGSLAWFQIASPANWGYTEIGRIVKTIDHILLGEKVLSPGRILLLVSILFAAVAIGCTQNRAGAPDREKRPPQLEVPEKPETAAPPVLSKGSGIKKKIPVKVKTGDRLGWVDNALKTYPPEQFITGLGIAPDRKTAQKRALQELAKPFDKAISGRLKMRRETLGEAIGPFGQEWHILTEKNHTHSRETAMEPARVAEIFIEKHPQPTIYALAVLSRGDCSRLLAPMVQGLDRQLTGIIRQIEQSGNRTQANQRKLLQAFVRREVLDAALSAAKQGGKGVPPSIEPQTIVRLLKEKSKKN